MSNSWYQSQPDYLANYAQHLLRWNKGINLVSRQNTNELLEDLFRQCSGGFSALWSHLEEKGLVPDPGPVNYFDLGSGGGIPGVIWHYHFCQKGARPQTCLVEPRDKRAWFLGRVPGDPSVTPFEVFQGRWAQDGWRLPQPHLGSKSNEAIYIVSLKALHLTDEEVLSGMVGAQGRVIIARYYPSEQNLDADLELHLGAGPATARLLAGGHAWLAGGLEILKWSKPGSREACLVISSYSP